MMSKLRPYLSTTPLAQATLVLLLAACSGKIGDPPGFGTSTGGNTTGAGGSNIPPPPPPDAPTVGPFATSPAPSTRLARLNHRQWENTVSDIFRGAAPKDLSQDFLSEPIRSSFDNNGGVLEVSSALWTDYQRAAQTIAVAARTQTIYGSFLNAGAKDAAVFIKNLGLRVYRRPLADAEVAEYQTLFNRGTELVGSTDPFADGVELVIDAMLQSPQFLYREELGTNVVNGRVPLTPYEIATRLSYGLVNSMPDDQLFAAAAGSALGTRDQVLVQAQRLLESDRGKETLRDLHDQSLKLNEFTGVVRSTTFFPQFKPEMAGDMKVEAETFVREVVYTQNKEVAELLTAPYTYVNSRLAPLYGANVPAPGAGQPDPFVKVGLDATQRAGIYTQIGFLAVNATDVAPRSIMRGVHANLDVLCVQLPAPPNVPPQTPSDPGKTNRQVLESFTMQPGSVCLGCHGALINPLGFAFENFDGLGKYRTAEANGMPIDASSAYTFTEGRQSYNGAVELMKIIASGRQAHDCYAQRLFEYVYGRERIKEGDYKAADDGVIGEVGRRSQHSAPIKQMILDLVSTDAFTTRLP
jgi:hypothetical protein